MSQPGIPPVETTGSAPVVPRWYRVARTAGFILLAGITLFGIRELLTGDTSAVAEYWTHKLPWLPLVLTLFAADLFLEGVAWIAVYERFGMRARDRTGFMIYLSGNAGLLLPAQLGRLIRPDSMTRAKRGVLADCMKAEASVFVLDALSVAALLAGLLLWRVHPLAAPLGAITIIAVFLYLGHRVADRLAGTRLGLPHGFWWHWHSAAIVLVEMCGWLLNGAALFVLVANLPGNVGLWEALFYAPGSAIFGVATGLPGGIGATEGALGTALRLNAVPAAHLTLVVAAFRLITFWLRLPIGWIALAIVHRRVKREAAAAAKPLDLDGANLPPGNLNAHADRS